MIKAILFDVGGVLTEGGKVGAIRNIFAEAYNINPEILIGSEMGLNALLGKISDDDFLSYMNKTYATTQQVTKEYFLKTIDHMTPCQPVYRLAEKLRAQGIKTGIVSNVFAMTAEVLRQRGMYDNFDPVLLSNEVHLVKPDPAFYALALQRLGLPTHEVLFIDDQDKALVPARTIGMHTVLAVSPQQIVRDVEDCVAKENNTAL